MKVQVAFVGPHQVGTDQPREARIVQLHVHPDDAAAFEVGPWIELEVEGSIPTPSPEFFPLVESAEPK